MTDHERPEEPLGWVTRSAGAAAFLAATAVATVAQELDLAWLCEPGAAAGLARAEIMARLLHVDPADPAVLLAAGAPPVADDDTDEGTAARHAAAQLLAAVDSADVPEGDREWLTAARCRVAPVDGSEAGDAGDAGDDGDDRGAMVLASALGRVFLRRLVGFHSSPLAYVVPRVFAPAGTVHADAGTITVELDRPPLLVVLQLAGLADFVTTLPWLGATVIVHHEVD